MKARAKVSDAGAVLLPKALRDAYDLKPGTELDIADDGHGIILTPVKTGGEADEAGRKLAVEEFLARIPRYEGPPITDDTIREAIDREAMRDWTRLEHQRNDNKND